MERKDLASVERQLAALREELAQLRRTIVFQEAEYLKGHGGSWGVCKYQAENIELRERLKEALELLALPKVEGDSGPSRNPSREWLEKAATNEEGHDVSVGGLAADLGLYKAKQSK